MKQFIMLNGTMGAGKSYVSKALNERLTKSVWLDGDWCWMANPFVVNEDTKAMVIDNITHILRNFLLQDAYEHIIFCWVMDEEAIVNAILDRLKDLFFHHVLITLRLQDETLIEHLNKDIQTGVRLPGCIEKSLERQKKYEQMDTIKIDVDHRSLEDILDEIERVLHNGKSTTRHE